MVCRMVIAVGEFRVNHLLDGFRLMAMNRNEKHEHNKNDIGFVHGDGWGIVSGKLGKLELYKKEVACWNDPKYHHYYNVDMDFAILHARRASPGTPVEYSFTHPFEKNGWYFCHNGTINDFKSKGRSDSEQFFSIILDNLRQHGDAKEAIKKRVNQVKKYTALNFILSDKNKAYILEKYRQSPEYYTMKYLQNKKYVIVSSEVLPNFEAEWGKIANNFIVELDIIGREIVTFTC